MQLYLENIEKRIQFVVVVIVVLFFLEKHCHRSIAFIYFDLMKMLSMTISWSSLNFSVLGPRLGS